MWAATRRHIYILLGLISSYHAKFREADSYHDLLTINEADKVNRRNCCSTAGQHEKPPEEQADEHFSILSETCILRQVSRKLRDE